MDVDPTRLHYVNVYKLQRKEVNLPKHLCVSLIEPDFEPFAEISEVYKEMLANVTGLDEGIFPEKEENAAEHDWTKIVDIGNQYES